MPDMTLHGLKSSGAPESLRALLRHRQSGVGKCVAVAGTNAAAHMVIRIARAMGAEVSVLAPVITRTDRLWLGADHYFATTDAMMRRALEGAFDLIVCTDPAIGVKDCIDLLKLEGAILMAEVPVSPASADFLNEALAFCVL
ncbi:MAG: hypothetical protein QM647_02285 [Asticcacaulis sp.]|uniref:hypothetical protein n=1 Tax=Asticcacaulis sp. TaxID=1872648 RepID=UPI0039E3686E